MALFADVIVSSTLGVILPPIRIAQVRRLKLQDNRIIESTISLLNTFQQTFVI